jgi:hypothetical protein
MFVPHPVLIRATDLWPPSLASHILTFAPYGLSKFRGGSHSVVLTLACRSGRLLRLFSYLVRRGRPLLEVEEKVQPIYVPLPSQSLCGPHRRLAHLGVRRDRSGSLISVVSTTEVIRDPQRRRRDMS